MVSVNLPDSFSYDSVGGDKADYGDIGAVDPSTDRIASEMNMALSAIAMSTRTIPRGYVRFTTAATTGGLVLVDWNATWKGESPTAPVLVRSSGGVFTATFPASVVDEQGNSHSTNILNATGNIEGTTFGFINVSFSSNVITIRIANTAGSANDLVGTTVGVMFR